jgi:uncharacterized RDD family membrane protein YckC
MEKGFIKMISHEQRATQMSIYFIVVFLMAYGFQSDLEAFIIGSPTFLYLERWYGVPISFPLVMLLFIILLGMFCFFIDFSKIDVEK